MTVIEPAPRPCESCPYRQDVPSGVWDESEYRKLPEYDKQTLEQPPGLFLCHQQNGRVCGGWAACHASQTGPYALMSLRWAYNLGTVTPEVLDSIFDYMSPVPVFSTGQEAMEHGLKELEEPTEEALHIMQKIERKQSNG
jgi:hypothetical protein